MTKLSTRPRVLVFSTILPMPVDRGDKNRLFHILLSLQGVADVRLSAISREWDNSEAMDAADSGVSTRSVSVRSASIVGKAVRDVFMLRPFLMFRYDISAVNAFIQSQIREFTPDVFWGFQVSSAPFLRHASAIGRVLDMVDSPSRYIAAIRSDSRFASMGRIQSLVQGRILHYEKSAVRASHVALVNSDADRHHMISHHECPDRIWTLPNCVPLSWLANRWVPHYGRSVSRILFVGNLAYAPNAAAVSFFIDEVLPLLQSRGRSIEFHVIGRISESQAEAIRRAPNVIVRGFVADLVVEYLFADLLVVPVPHAGGAQYKLLEAMAIGLPVVASYETATATGMMESGEKIMIAREAPQYVRAIEHLLDDQTFAEQLSARARDWVRMEHTWEAQQPLLDRTLEVALSKSRMNTR